MSLCPLAISVPAEYALDREMAAFAALLVLLILCSPARFWGLPAPQYVFETIILYKATRPLVPSEAFALYAMVCKQLRNLAQPFLHREFMLGYGDSWLSDKFTWNGRLFSFLRTVARRGDLAAQVKRIWIHPQLWESHRAKDEVNFWMTPENPVWRFGSWFYQCDVRDVLGDVADARGIDAVRTLSEHDLIAVLISLLPNLRHCGLQLGVDRDDVTPAAGLRAATASVLPIRTMDLAMCATACESRKLYGKISILQRAFGLLTLSIGLETLNLHQYYGIFSDERDPIPALPNLKHLRLTFCWLDDQTLRRLLSSCSSLQTFHYEATSNPERYNIGYYPLNLVYTGNIHFRLVDAVRHLRSLHCNTLESVHLDLRMRGFTPCTPEPWAAFSFQNFTRLQHLSLTLDEFHPVYMDPHLTPRQGLTALLPSALTSLSLAGQITQEPPRMEQSLRGLAEAVSRGYRFPNLKVVRWDETQRLSDDFTIKITPMFSEAGVDFSYTAWPLSRSTLGESQSLAHPSYFDDGYRHDPHRFVSPSDLPPVPQPAWDETDPDL
ncbi:hypothetical protein BJY00DRAFT_315014 [Aspergillus carlsbadensis]|nr:hypothetical protein BJY00DRAFT_315014 [Aspergillus carlsbadensis]